LQDAADGAKLVIDYNLIKTSVDVQFYDAATGELIGRSGDQSVMVKVAGPDKAGVIDITGVQPQNMQFVSQRGFVGLALLPESTYLPVICRQVKWFGFRKPDVARSG